MKQTINQQLKTWIVVIALQGSMANFVQAAQVYVEQATGPNVSPGDLTAATTLIKNSIPEVSGDTVVESPSAADFSLRPKLLKLSEAYILSLGKVVSDQLVSSSSLKAAHMDELDQVAKRLTRSVLLGENASSSPRVGELTDQESKHGTERRPARRQSYLGLGGATLGNLSTSGVGYSVGAAYSWDLNITRIKLMGEGDFKNSAFFLSGGLGLNYYLGLEDVAPYIGADFGLGAAKVNQGVLSGSTLGGFVAAADAGIELLRTSEVSLDLGLRWAFLLHSNSLGTPRALSFRLGLNF